MKIIIELFLDQQASTEIKNKVNIRLENKRYLKGFEESIKSFTIGIFIIFLKKLLLVISLKIFAGNIL